MPVLSAAEGPPVRGLRRELSRTAWEPALLKMWIYSDSQTSWRLIRLSGLGSQLCTLAEAASIS